jgi:hypothetical protein
MSEASKSVSRMTNIDSFLIAEADLDLMDSVSEIYCMTPHERVDQLDRVIGSVRQSACQTYRRK